MAAPSRSPPIAWGAWLGRRATRGRLDANRESRPRANLRSRCHAPDNAGFDQRPTTIHDLYATIARTAIGGRVVPDRHRQAETRHIDARSCDALPDQVVANG